MFINDEIKINDLKGDIDLCIENMIKSDDVIDINVSFVTGVSRLNRIYEIIRDDYNNNHDKGELKNDSGRRR